MPYAQRRWPAPGGDAALSDGDDPAQAEPLEGAPQQATIMGDVGWILALVLGAAVMADVLLTLLGNG